MMQINAIFENVKAYDVNKLDVKLGESFRIELVDNLDLTRWFADNDKVLDITAEENGAGASIKTTAVGKSEIQLQKDGKTVETIYIEVYDKIAVTLNPVVDNPILK
jgi:hypothetical protein